MPAVLPETGDQLAMIEVLRSCGWTGSARISTSSGGVQIEVHGDPLSAFLLARGPLQYEEAVDLLHCIAPQLERLRVRGRGMPSIELEDILVLGEGWYLLTGLHRSWEIEGGDKREFVMASKAPPISRTRADPGTLGGDHLAPELRGRLSLPMECTSAATVYNLGSLIRASLGLEHNLAPLAGSKLYHCIRRCLVEDPNKRHLIFI